MKNIPTYTHSLSQVQALQIYDLQGNWIMPEEKGFDRFKVPSEFMERYDPEPGGYFIIYPGGRQSYLPESMFEDWFTKNT